MFCSALMVVRLYDEYCSVQDHSEGLDHTRENQRSLMLMWHYLVSWRTMTRRMAVHTLDKSTNSCYSSEMRTHHCTLVVNPCRSLDQETAAGFFFKKSSTQPHRPWN